MSSESVTKGQVAFFDILGYKNIINNNKIESVAELISCELLEIPNRVHKFIRKKFSALLEDNKKALDNLDEKLSVVLISDSILLTLNIDKNGYGDSEKTIWSWLIFIIACRKLMTTMFEQGLPVKGAIDCGQFFVKDHCFAGKTIVNAYDLANDLELSGCVLTPHASDRVKEALQSANDTALKSFFDEILFEYLTPLKGSEEKMLTIIDLPILTNNFHEDLKQIVVNSFQAHNKDIPGEAYTKVRNTEMMLRFLWQKRRLIKEKS